MAKFEPTDRVVVNGVEIQFDEIREVPLIGVIPVVVSGVVVNEVLGETNIKQKHYYKDGVKVCSDVYDSFNNLRHSMDCPVIKFTKDDLSVTYVTHFPTFEPDTDNCKVREAYHILNPNTRHAISVLNNRYSGSSVESSIAKIVSENQNKNKAIKKLCETLPELTKKDQDGNDVPDLDKISFNFDANRKLILNCKGINANKLSRRDLAKSEVEKEIGAGKVDIVAV